jgi:hypothetical protein
MKESDSTEFEKLIPEGSFVLGCLGRQKPVPEDVFLEFDALEQLLL